MPGPAASGPGPGELADLIELLAGGQLLGEQGRLDAVEQTLEPADELRLGDADLPFRRHLAVAERQGQHLQLLLEVRGQGVGQLGDGALVDLGQPLPARFVERGGPHLLEQRLDHRADPHDLGRRGHRVASELLRRLVGRSIDDLTVLDRAGARIRGRALRVEVRHGASFLEDSAVGRDEGHEHLRRGQRPVAADQLERSRVGGIVEAHRLRGRRGPRHRDGQRSVGRASARTTPRRSSVDG